MTRSRGRKSAASRSSSRSTSTLPMKAITPMAPPTSEDDLIDDSSNEIPMTGLTKSSSLEDRFRSRLSYVLDANVTVHWGNVMQLPKIYVTPRNGARTFTSTDHTRMRTVTEEIQRTLRNIARVDNDGPERNRAIIQLWVCILDHVSPKIDQAAKSLQTAYQIHNTRYAAAVGTMRDLMGDTQPAASSGQTDDQGRDFIIDLHNMIHAYHDPPPAVQGLLIDVGEGPSDESSQSPPLTDEEYIVERRNKLTEFVWKSIRAFADMPVQLRSLLGSKFSGEVCDLVCTLSHFRRAHHTFIRMASSETALKGVSVYLRDPPCLSTKAAKRPTSTTVAPRIPQALHNFEFAETSSRPIMSDEAVIKAFLPCLAQKGRGLNMEQLEPPLRRSIAQLVAYVAHGTLLPSNSEEHYIFGFVACQTENDEHSLAQCYKRLLHSTADQTAIFKHMIDALKTGTLLALFRNKGVRTLDQAPEVLKSFLATAPQKRSSVFRLVQFIRDTDNEEPPPVLIRDYGFRYCTQREHVAQLKDLYARILTNADSHDVHYACRNGNLLGFAQETLGYVDKSQHRLLKNDYPDSNIAVDNGLWPRDYELPFYSTSRQAS